jgi:hypothetical protein
MNAHDIDWRFNNHGAAPSLASVDGRSVARVVHSVPDLRRDFVAAAVFI